LDVAIPVENVIVYDPVLVLATVETLPPEVGAFVPVVAPLNVHHALIPKIGAEPLCAPFNLAAVIEAFGIEEADRVAVTFPLASTLKTSAVVAPLLPLASLIVPSGEDGTERVKFWVAVADWPI
jgi:hypothetical protein